MSDPLADLGGFLQSVELFGGLDGAGRAVIASACELIRPSGDTLLFEEGDAGDAMYVVVFGQVRILRKAPDGALLELATIGPRGVFGEMALYDDVPRSAAARVAARASAALLVLRREAFAGLVRDRSEIALRMLATQNRRIRMLNDRLLATDHSARRYAPTLEETVAEEFPHPLAQVFHDAHAQSEVRARLQRFLELLEVVMRYQFSLAVACYLRAARYDGAIDHELCVGARAMTLGAQFRAIRMVTTHLVETHGEGGIVVALHAWLHGKGAVRHPVAELFDKLLQIRNDMKHGAEGTLDQPALEALLADVEPRMRTLLTSLDFFREFPLLYLQSMNFVEGRFRYATQRCHGAFRSFRTEPLTAATPHELERLYVLEPATGRLLPLYPWVHMTRCEVCGDRDIFFARTMHPKTMEMIEFERGHMLTARTLPAEYGAMLTGLRERIRGTEHDLA